MATQPQTSAPKIDLGQVLEIAKQLGLVDVLKNALLGLFKKTPKPPVLAPPIPAPPVNVPTPIPAPSASTPEPGQTARQIARVRLRIQKAERPDMSTPERLQDPGNLYPDPMGLVAAGDNFNYGTAFWFDLTAFDENGDEWQGESIIAANKEFRTEHRIYEGDRLIAWIKGEGDGNPTGLGEPLPWNQQNADEIHWAQRSWKDSVGRNARVRIGREGTFRIVGFLDGKESDSFIVHLS